MPERTSDLWWLFSRQTICVTQKESVFNAAILMEKRNFRHLPVITDDSRVAGIFSAQDIVDSLSLVLGHEKSSEKIIESLDIPVHRIMALYPIVVEKGDGLAEVVKKLIANNVGALPVIDEMGVVQGIITMRDIIGLMGTGSEPMGVTVSEIMSKNITTIDPDSTMSEAVRFMSDMRIRRLPVVSSDGNLLGMVTNKDILRLVSRLRTAESSFDEKISEHMTKEVITADPEDDVRLLVSRMVIFNIGGIAINDERAKIMGLVTERDLVKRLAEVRSVSFLVNSLKFELELQN
jgi:CBS domain-containing protein